MEDAQDSSKRPFWKREIVHGSMDEILSCEIRNSGYSLPIRYITGAMEENDPGGRRSHEITKRYRQ